MTRGNSQIPTKYGSCSSLLHLGLDPSDGNTVANSSWSLCRIPGFAMMWYDMTESVCATVIDLEHEARQQIMYVIPSR